ncbi:hypothetical protein K490DRAFT_13810, partial [Saccharata proteae CBS 121410]
SRTSVPVACVGCRSRHLKCSGGPRCARCIADGLNCSYVKSRRGFKGPRKRPAADQMDRFQQQDASFDQFGSCRASVVLQQGGSSPHVLGAGILTTQNQLRYDPRAVQSLRDTNLPNTTSAFLHNFYSAHPFLLPRDQLLDLLRSKRVPYLETAIHYIGSCFLPNVSTHVWEGALNQALLQPESPKDPHAVQALLLYAIGLKANDYTEKSQEVLAKAVDLALSLGMNERNFAIQHSEGNPLVEESWRRTWYELYVIDGFFAALNQKQTFRLRDVISDVGLPCEEAEYASGCIPRPKTFHDYEDAAFMDDEVQFSSFTFRIDAVRNLGRVLAVSRPDLLDSRAIEVVDSYLVNWGLHLPASKKEVITRDGQLDHMLFQAHMIANGAMILLHKPRSDLDEIRSVDDIKTCVAPGEPFLATQTREYHTAKCMEASQELSKLIRLPSPLERYTPFFTCVVVMSSVVYLSYWSFIVPDGEDGPIKELIRLNTGVLKSLAVQWPVAKTVLGQVKGVAQEMFSSKRATSLHWNGVAAADLLQMIEDDGS